MIKAVAFDLWETLITNTPELSRAQEGLRRERMTDVLAARGFSLSADTIEHAHRLTWQRCQELYWSLDRDIPCRRQVEHFLEGLELEAVDEATLELLEDAYANVAVDIPPNVMTGADEVVRELKSRGLLLGMISNTGRTPGSALREVLHRLGLGTALDVMVFSNEHGACKPVPSIFEELRAGLGVAFDEMLFIGDNLYVDVHGAQRCGMRAIHLDSPTRGTAVAPPVEHDLTIVPDATIRELRELPAALQFLQVQAGAPRIGFVQQA